MKPNFIKVLIPFLILAWMLPACAPQVTVTPFVAATPSPTLLAVGTPTPATRSLNICLGEEPNTLYPYDNLNSAARSVLSAIYDGPMDVTDYGYEPIILEKIPNLEDGDAQVSPVSVSAGSQVVDAERECRAAQYRYQGASEWLSQRRLCDQLRRFQHPPNGSTRRDLHHAGGLDVV